MINSLLPELKEKIFIYLQCKYIISLSQCCSSLNKFIKGNDIVHKRKYQGFPRPEGHYKTYFYDADNIIKSSDNSDNSDNINPIRGDLMLSISKDYPIPSGVFDGCKFIKLASGNRIALPPEFTIINNNVPINYWHRPRDGTCGGFANTFKMWFDVNDDVRKQLLENIKDDGMMFFEKYQPNEDCLDRILYTHFTLNNKIYYIMSMLSGSRKKEFFRINDVFTSRSKILLDLDDHEYLFNVKLADNIIFLTSNVYAS